MTIQEIEAKVQRELADAHERATPLTRTLAPLRPCPACAGVLREDSELYLVCWTCGAVVGLPVERR